MSTLGWKLFQCLSPRSQEPLPKHSDQSDGESRRVALFTYHGGSVISAEEMDRRCVYPATISTALGP